MALGAPASKVNELIERLQSAGWARDANEFELAAITRDARALMGVDAASAHMVLGAVAAVRGDIKQTRDHYRIAMQPGSSADTAKRNYSVALARLGEHEDALAAAVELVEAHPSDAALLGHAIQQAMESAYFGQAAKMCQQFDEPAQPNSLAATLQQLVAAVSKGSFTEEGVRVLLHGAALIQREAGLPTARIELRAYDQGDAFLYTRHLHATPATAAALNGRLADFAAAAPGLLDDPGLKFVAAFGVSEGNAGNA